MNRFVKANQDKHFEAIAERFLLNEEESTYLMDFLRYLAITFLHGGLYTVEKSNAFLFAREDPYLTKMKNVPLLLGGVQNPSLSF